MLGQGEGLSQEWRHVEDVPREGKSIWNRREGTIETNLDYGNTAAQDAEGQAFLTENKPTFKLSGDVIETESFMYGRDWHHGDMVTVLYDGEQRDAMIDRVFFKLDKSGQRQVSARLEVSA